MRKVVGKAGVELLLKRAFSDSRSPSIRWTCPLISQFSQSSQSNINQRCFSTSPKEARADDPPQLWVKSPYPDIEPVVGKTVSEMVWEQTVQFGDAPAIECPLTGRKYNYEEFFRYSRGFAASLIKHGIQRGSTVGIVLPNIPEFPIALFGCFDAGCIVSSVNPSYTSEEIGRQLTMSEASAVVTVELFLPAILSAKSNYPNLKTIIVVGKAPEGCLSFFDMMKQDPTGFDFVRGSEINTVESTCLLPFSSGTTGPPKGVMLTHTNLATNLRQYIQPDVTIVESMLDRPDRSQERIIGLLPFFHAYGLSAVMVLGLHQGAHIMCLPKFEPATFISTIRRHRPTVMHLVTPLISFMVQSPEIGREELASTHSIIGAAAPIGPVLIHKILEKAGKYIFFQEGYGMTELSPASHVLNPSSKNSKVGSCGTPIPSTVCKIVDVVTGKTLGPNERGELCVRGPQVMKGYFKNEQATAETIDQDNWLHTGDIAYYDEDSHFYIVDRLKELIKVKGLQVAPSELEDILREHPGVGDVAVIGVPDEQSGELPRAYIVRKNDRLSAEDIHQYLQDKVSKHKQLRGGIEFVDIIPKAASGKILRRELMADYKEKHGLQ